MVRFVDKADIGDVRWCGNSHVPNLPEADICGALYDVRFQELSGSVVSTSRLALLEAGTVPLRLSLF